MPDSKKHSFTLIEVLVVIVIIGILAAVAVPNFIKTKYNALSKEAVSNIKLIAAAEKIYKLENNVYISCSNAANCNALLKLDLITSNWNYRVTLSAGVATITATLTVNSQCTYTLTSRDFNAEPIKSSGCPAGMI
ncbi:MAG: prepilin-type N-terminal cleavage/methylation domain-containing protein [Candidatus Omnitrophota bacterium]